MWLQALAPGALLRRATSTPFSSTLLFIAAMLAAYAYVMATDSKDVFVPDRVPPAAAAFPLYYADGVRLTLTCSHGYAPLLLSCALCCCMIWFSARRRDARTGRHMRLKGMQTGPCVRNRWLAKAGKVLLQMGMRKPKIVGIGIGVGISLLGLACMHACAFLRDLTCLQSPYPLALPPGLCLPSGTSQASPSLIPLHLPWVPSSTFPSSAQGTSSPLPLMLRVHARPPRFPPSLPFLTLSSPSTTPLRTVT